MTVTIGILVLQWSILSFRTVLDGIWHRFEQRLIPEPLELVLSWALSSSCAPQQDCTSNLNPHSCQGTCSLQGMIKAEHSGCCLLVPGQFSKAGALEAALRRVGDKQWKHWVHVPSPHISPSTGTAQLSQPSKWQKETQKRCRCISAAAELVVTSGPWLCLGRGSKGRWSHCGVSLMLLIPPLLPGCVCESLHVSHKPQDCLICTPRVSITCRNPSAASQCPHKSVNVLLFPAAKGVFLY